MCFLWKTLPVKFVDSWPFLFSLLYFYISVSYLWSCFLFFCFVLWSRDEAKVDVEWLSARYWENGRDREREEETEGEEEREMKRGRNPTLKQTIWIWNKKEKNCFWLRDQTCDHLWFKKMYCNYNLQGILSILM